jgi:hypothetical protein
MTTPTSRRSSRGCSWPTLPATITFAAEGGREESGNYLVDSSRLRTEFGIEYPPLRTRVLDIINDVRRQERLPLVTPR